MPYIWDELGVHARAALHLHDNGLSLLPDALPPHLSRGHPTLFVFLVAVFFSVLGTALWVGHLYPFFLALLMIVAVFWSGRKYFHPFIGLGAAVILMSQPIFFAQAGLILPEMQLTLFCFLAIHFYFQKQWLSYFIVASLAVLTKEPAILLPGILIVLRLASVLKSHKTLRVGQLVRQLLVVIAPLGVFGLFLIVQKVQNGWFFFPRHISFFKTDLTYLYDRFLAVSNFIFLEQGRWSWLIILGIATFFWLIGHKGRYKRALGQIMGDKLIATYTLTILIFFVSFLLSPNMNRYTLIAFPFLVMVLAIMIWHMTQQRALYFLPLVVAISIIHLMYQKNNDFDYHVDLDYTNVINVQRKATQYLETLQLSRGQLKIHTNFPLSYGLEDNRLGFLAKSKELNINKSILNEVDYIVKITPGSPIELNLKTEVNLQDKSKFELVKIFKDGYAEVRVYKLLHIFPKR